MMDVIIALLPAGFAGVYFFGWKALYLILISVASAVLWEAIIQKIMKKPVTVDDLSAVVTGLLLAYNLPPTVPLWLPIVGSALAVVLVKQIFGGIGQNFMNPALTARTILMASWMAYMSGAAFIGHGFSVDAVSVATPLVAQPNVFSMEDLMFGYIPGCIGETCKIALLAGGVYLMALGIISWRIPITMIATVFGLSWIASGSIDSAAYQILSGGLFLGAFFMATDYATSPVTSIGKIIMGVGCGAILFVIRGYNPTYPEGCSYAILIMNMATPLIDRFTKPRVYGEVKAHG